MALYVISDLHLSTAQETDKSMEVFGGRWDGYVDRLRANWEKLIGKNDTVVIPGDVSWGLTADEALSDLLFLDSLPGHKILLKGNHDLWWATMKKNRAFCEAHDIHTLEFIYNNAAETDDFIIAGTRGWFADEDMGKTQGADFEKVRLREIGRLRASLTDAVQRKRLSPQKEILVFTHFPVVSETDFEDGLASLIEESGVRRVYYGHVHGNYQIPAVLSRNGVEYHLTSADYLNFLPKYINVCSPT